MYIALNVQQCMQEKIETCKVCGKNAVKQYSPEYGKELNLGSETICAVSQSSTDIPFKSMILHTNDIHTLGTEEKPQICNKP